MSSVYVPYERPVIQPDLFGTLPTNVPRPGRDLGAIQTPTAIHRQPGARLAFRFPFFHLRRFAKLRAGPPTAAASPTFVSLDMNDVSKDFRIAFIPWVRKHTLRG